MMGTPWELHVTYYTETGTDGHMSLRSSQALKARRVWRSTSPGPGRVCVMTRRPGKARPYLECVWLALGKFIPPPGGRGT